MNKNIIICCDGTGNEFGKNNTNVVKIYQMADKGNSNEQVAYYDPGVGTGGWGYGWGSAWGYKRIMGYFKQKSDGATGGGLQKNVEDAYQYLMRCYEAGDKIYLFGFSRGAFTARSLAGMLYKCGLLHADMHNMVKYTSKMYNNRGNEKIAKRFKETFSRQCPVHFIGVWDTVESLDLNAGAKFHDASLNSEVSYGYHAVALDEIRKKFPPSLWSDRENVEQVWFAGVHSDVGGWYGDSDLSNIALKWMANKALESGLLIDAEKIDAIKGNPLGMQHDSHTGAFWNVMGKYIRQLPPNAKVHESIKERLGKDIKIGDEKDEEKSKSAYKTEAEMDGEKLSAESSVKWVS